MAATTIPPRQLTDREILELVVRSQTDLVEALSVFSSRQDKRHDQIVALVASGNQELRDAVITLLTASTPAQDVPSSRQGVVTITTPQNAPQAPVGTSATDEKPQSDKPPQSSTVEVPMTEGMRMTVGSGADRTEISIGGKHWGRVWPILLWLVTAVAGAAGITKLLQIGRP